MERNTRQRSAIQDAIEAAKRPLGVHEILATARRSHPTLGIATVYRAVKALVDAQVLRPVEIPGAVARYELAHLAHHHHFHCRACDRVFEIESCPGSLQGMTPRGFRMESHDLTITGLCAGCVRAPGKGGRTRARRDRRSGAHRHPH
jgi:Fur family ferric uptake transcriptional regulator